MNTQQKRKTEMSMITNENKAQAAFMLAEIHTRNAIKAERVGNTELQEHYTTQAEVAIKIAMDASNLGVEWFLSEAIIHEIG